MGHDMRPIISNNIKYMTYISIFISLPFYDYIDKQYIENYMALICIPTLIAKLQL